MTLNTIFSVVETRGLCQPQRRSYVNTNCSIRHLMHPQSTDFFNQTLQSTLSRLEQLAIIFCSLESSRLVINFLLEYEVPSKHWHPFAHHNVCELQNFKVITYFLQYNTHENVTSTCEFFFFKADLVFQFFGMHLNFGNKIVIDRSCFQRPIQVGLPCI